jgi:hypothetical protein
VLSGPWKLIEQYEDGSVELFDLEADPGETRNLASESPKEASRLKAMLHDWLGRVGAQMPSANPGAEGLPK